MKKSISFILILILISNLTLVNAQTNKEKQELSFITEKLDSLDYNFFDKWSFHYRTGSSSAWYFTGEKSFTCDLIIDFDKKQLIGIAKSKNFVENYNLNFNVENVTAWLWTERFTDKIVFTKTNLLENKKETIGILYKNEPVFTEINDLFDKLIVYKNKLIKLGIADVYYLDENNNALAFVAYQNKYSLIKLKDDINENQTVEILKKYKKLRQNWWYFISN